MVSSLCSFCVPGSSTLSPASKATFRHRTPVGLGCGALDSGCSLLSHWSAFSPTASTSTSSSSFSTFRHLVRLLVLIATKRFQILLVLKEFFLYRTWSRTNANFWRNCLLISFVSATRNPVTDRKHSYVSQEIPLLTYYVSRNSIVDVHRNGFSVSRNSIADVMFLWGCQHYSESIGCVIVPWTGWHVTD